VQVGHLWAGRASAYGFRHAACCMACGWIIQLVAINLANPGEEVETQMTGTGWAWPQYVFSLHKFHFASLCTLGSKSHHPFPISFVLRANRAPRFHCLPPRTVVFNIYEYYFLSLGHDLLTFVSTLEIWPLFTFSLQKSAAAGRAISCYIIHWTTRCILLAAHRTCPTRSS
jgi:hypothetical protein